MERYIVMCNTKTDADLEEGVRAVYLHAEGYEDIDEMQWCWKNLGFDKEDVIVLLVE